jgi:hypothetical protein
VEGADHAAAAQGWRADASGGGGALSVAMLAMQAVAATAAAAERGATCRRQKNPTVKSFVGYGRRTIQNKCRTKKCPRFVLFSCERLITNDFGLINLHNLQENLFTLNLYQ